jgi:Fe-S oxidoreductase
MFKGEAAELLAANARLFEEFIALEHKEGQLNLALGPLPKKTFLHGHCHQKAFDALGATRSLLERIPGLAVDVVESSCCGMAGSFGYEAEHYGISMAMAEASLLPAVRGASADILIVAGGTSCRHQIADGTRGADARTALHPVRVLERALATA